MSPVSTQKKLSMVFIGYANNGARSLAAVSQLDLDIRLVITPKEQSVEIISQAKKHNHPFLHHQQKKDWLYRQINKLKPDLIVVASFPYLLKKGVIDIPKFGVINVHTGNLPRYRGYHPLNWALIRDEKTIGATVHYIDEGMDTGDILLQKTFPITNKDTINSLKNRANVLGSKLLVQVVKKFMKQRKKIPGVSQVDSQASYAPRRYPKDGLIKWTNSTRDIFNLIRALESPYPNAFTHSKSGEKVNISSSYIHPQAGTVLGEFRDHYLVSTGDGAILVKTNAKLNIGEIFK